VVSCKWIGGTGNDDDPSAKVAPLLPEVAEVLRARLREMVVAQHPGLAEGWVFPTEKGTLYCAARSGRVRKRKAPRSRSLCGGATRI